MSSSIPLKDGEPVLCEYMGLKMPIVAVPCVLTNSGLDTHPAFLTSITRLREYGVRVIYEPETYPPKNEVPWGIILEALHAHIAYMGTTTGRIPEERPAFEEG